MTLWRPATQHWRWAAWIAVCLVTAFVCAPRADWPRLRMRYDNTAAVEQMGLAGYALFDFGDTAVNLWRKMALRSIDPTPYRVYLEQLASTRRRPPPGPPSRKHVIFVQMESVDGLAIGSRYHGRPLMPFLEELAKGSLYFANTVNNTATGRTTDAELMVLTSQVPLRRPPAFVSEPLDRVPSLPKVLRAAGYHCFGIHGFHGSFWRRRAAHAALGYEEDIYEEQLGQVETIGWGVSDRAVLHQAAARIIASKGPVFAHIILLTNHHPYTYVGQFLGQPHPRIEASYVQSLAYVDQSIAAFFGELKAAGLLSNSIVAVFSDHDSAITARMRRFVEEAPRRVTNDTVPLIITGLPETPREIDAVAGLQDVPVIVLEALGLPVPFTFTGHDLDGLGWTVAAKYGAVRGTPNGLEPMALPVSPEILTRLALNYPEKLTPP